VRVCVWGGVEEVSDCVGVWACVCGCACENVCLHYSLCVYVGLSVSLSLPLSLAFALSLSVCVCVSVSVCVLYGEAYKTVTEKDLQKEARGFPENEEGAGRLSSNNNKKQTTLRCIDMGIDR